MQGLPDTAARWALRGSEDPGRSGPWKQCWPTVITTVQPVGQVKWLYPTTQLSWDQHLGTASGFRSSNTRKTLLNLREFYEDHKVWWNWSMGRSLASLYLNKNSQEIGIFCSRTEIIHDQVFSSHSHGRRLASHSFRSTNKAISCCPNFKIMTILEGELIQMYHPILQT